MWLSKAPKPSGRPKLDAARVEEVAAGLGARLAAGGAGPGAPAAGDAGRGAGTAGTGEGPDVVAVYAYGTVTRSQLDAYITDELGGIRLADLEGDEEDKLEFAQAMLHQLILDEMMLKEAEKKGIQQREGVQRALQHLAEDENIAELAERVGTRILVSEADIAEYYEKHRDVFKDVTLDSARSLIKALVRREKAAQAFEAYINRLKEQATIERHFDLLGNPNADPGAALFVVNGKAYTLREFRAELARLPEAERRRYTTRQAQEELLERILTRTLLLDAASTIADADTRRRIERLRRMLLCSALHREEVDSQVRVGAREVADYYEQVKEEWRTEARARIAYVSIPYGRTSQEATQSETLLREIRQTLEAGAGFSETVRQFRDRQPGIQGVDSAWVGEYSSLLAVTDRSAEDFRLLVFRVLEIGELSQPFRYGSRRYVVKVLEREAPRTPRQDEIDAFLQYELWAQKHQEAEDRYVRGLLDRSSLQVNRQALSEFVRAAPGSGSAMASQPGTQP